MRHNWDDILMAFEHVSSGMLFETQAVLNRETGEISFVSDSAFSGGDEAKFPDDIDDNPDTYIEIPHKNDLDCGKQLVEEFAARLPPDTQRQVADAFRHRGAYRRYKEILESAGKLNEWYAFESAREEQALLGKVTDL